MTQFAYISAALLIGFASAFQVAALTAIARVRGPIEGTWISLLATVAGVTILFVIRILANDPPKLPSPLQSAPLMGFIAIAACAALALSLRDLNYVWALTGLAGFVYLMAAGYLGPRIGIALFASAVVTGTLIGSVALDHIGPFGNEVRHVTPLRAAGLGALVVGVLLVRFGD